ncbi:MAG: BatD family protein [bacterium]
MSRDFKVSLPAAVVKEFMKVSLKRALPAILVITLLGVSAGAQQISFESQVDRTQVEVGDQLTYTATVTTAGQSGGVPAPEFPKFDGFNVVSDPIPSTQLSILNTQVSYSQSYSIQLEAIRPGEIVIPPAKLRIGGKEYSSHEITVEVKKPAQIELPPGLGNENLISAKTSDANLNRKLRGQLFARPVLDKKKVYIGEPVILSIYLYVDSRALDEGISIANWGTTAPGDFPGFITEEILKKDRLTAKEEQHGDRKFTYALLSQTLLVPTKAGQLAFSPPGLGVNLRLPVTRRSFDDFFMNDFFSASNTVAQLPFAPQTLEVFPLPAEGRPDNFKGTVGSYSLDATVDRQEAKEDDLVKLDLRFKGKGYATSIGKPDLPTTADFTVFDSAEKVEKDSEGDPLNSTKTFEYVLRPARPGTLTIPSVSYAIFDPEKASYATLHSQPFTLKVLPGENNAPIVLHQDVPSPTDRQPGMRVLVNAPDYIKTDGFLRNPSRGPLYEMGFFWAIQSFPLLALGSAFLYRRRSRYLTEHSDEVRKVQARGVVSRRFREAQQKLQAGEIDAFCEEMSKALREYLGDKFSVQASGLTADQAREMLESHEVDQETCAEAVGLLERSDTLRYAPGSASREELQTLMEDASRLVAALDKQLRRKSRALR